MTATGRLLSTSVGLMRRPRSASKLEKVMYSGDTPCTRMLSDQIASRAITTASKNLYIGGRWALPARPLLRRVIHLHQIAIGHAAHGVVRPGDHLIAGLEAAQHLEILVAGNAHLDREELGPAVTHQEDALLFFPRLPRLELRGGGDWFHAAAAAAAAPLVVPRLLHDLSVRV